MSLGVCGHLGLNILFTLFLLSISGTNYPGGTAVSHLHRLAKNETFVYVHIDNLAAQTGVSRFSQINPDWIYCKKEHILPGSPEIYEYTHLISEAKSRYSSNLKPYVSTHDIIDSIEAFHQITFNYLTIPPIKIKTKPVLFILKRRDNYRDFIPDSSELRNIQFDLDEIDNFSENAEKDTESETKLRLDYTTDSLKIAGIITRNAESEEEKLNAQVEEKITDKSLEEQKRKKPKSKELYKSTENMLQIDYVEPVTNAKSESGNVKKKIRKLISKYRRIKTEVDEPLPKETVIQEKTSVKKLIQQEKSNMEREELQKIELQVLELIESNPNIINKELIKNTIHTSIMKELNDTVEIINTKKSVKSKLNNRRKAKLISNTAKPATREQAPTPKVAPIKESAEEKDYTKLKGKDINRVVEEVGENDHDHGQSIEEHAHLDNAELNVDNQDNNAIDLYEQLQEDIEQSDDVNEISNEDVEETQQESSELNIDEKLQYANEQIENIMSIIAEIVDTIEVTDDDEEDTETLEGIR